MSAKFGPAGNSESFPYQSSLEAPAWLAEMGLDLYEYQCGRGVHVGEETARKLKEKAQQANITLTLHAPYFISLSNPDPDSLKRPSAMSFPPAGRPTGWAPSGWSSTAER